MRKLSCAESISEIISAWEMHESHAKCVRLVISDFLM